MDFLHSTVCKLCKIGIRLLNSVKPVGFDRKWYQGCTDVAKLATRATNGKFGVTQNRLSGGLGLDRGNWDFSGCIISSSLTSLEFQRTDDHLKLKPLVRIHCYDYFLCNVFHVIHAITH